MIRPASLAALVLLSLIAFGDDFAAAADAEKTCRKGGHGTCEADAEEAAPKPLQSGARPDSCQPSVPVLGSALLAKRASKRSTTNEAKEEAEDHDSENLENDTVLEEMPTPAHIHDEVTSMVQEGETRGEDTEEERSGSSTRDPFEPNWVALADKDTSKSTSAVNMKKMIDGDPATHGGCFKFQIDFGTQHSIEKTRIDFRTCKCQKRASLKMERSSDGKTWKAFHWPTISANVATAGTKTVTSDAKFDARYIRIWPSKACTSRWLQIYGIEFKGHYSPRPNVYGWYHSYKAGRDGLSGTEILHIVPYKGALFAGTGYWKHVGRPRTAEVARLDCPFCTWKVETAVRWAGRIESLKEAKWTTDKWGNKIRGGPKSKLLAGYYINPPGKGRCLLSGRQDGNKRWHESTYWERRPFRSNYFSARAMALYQDTVTKVDYLFVVTGMDGIIAGTYDASKFNWVEFPDRTESGPVQTRPLALTIHDGRIYFSASSYIMRRNNGKVPTWSNIFDMATVDVGVTVDEAVGGIRGLTSIAHPASNTGRSLLFAWSPNEQSGGCMIRLDPKDKQVTGFKSVQEGCVKDHAANYLGVNKNGLGALVVFVIADYNNVLEYRSGKKTLHIIGYQMLLYAWSAHDFPVSPGQVQTVNNKKMSFYAGAGFLVRHSATQYEVRAPGGPRYDPKDIYPSLVAVRAYAVSPFANDDAVYFGGHDCNHFPSKDTAWIFRGEADAIYRKKVPCQKELGCGHVPGKTFKVQGCDLCRGREFDGHNIVEWQNGKPKTCQVQQDWLNAGGRQHCSKYQKSDWARRCCRQCDICLGTGKRWKQFNKAGVDSAGKTYNCKEAKTYIESGQTTCYHGSLWWKGKCCK